MAFKQYLFEQTEMSPSTIREYVVRLRRLDEMLKARNFPADRLQGNSWHQCLESEIRVNPAASLRTDRTCAARCGNCYYRHRADRFPDTDASYFPEACRPGNFWPGISVWKAICPMPVITITASRCASTISS